MSVVSIKRRLGVALGGCLLAGLAASGTAGAQSPASQYRGLTTIEIPFANGPIRADHVPEIRLKLKGAAPHRFGMDTGSTGIVAASPASTARRSSSVMVMTVSYVAYAR